MQNALASEHCVCVCPMLTIARSIGCVYAAIWEQRRGDFTCGEPCLHSNHMTPCRRQVNTLSFNPLYGSLVSGGSDGEINVWDLEHRRRLFTKNCRAPVSCVAWTRSGMRMVVGTSWNMQQTNQDNDHKLRVDAIHVCNMQQDHVDPRLVKLVAD